MNIQIKTRYNIGDKFKIKDGDEEATYIIRNIKVDLSVKDYENKINYVFEKTSGSTHFQDGGNLTIKQIEDNLSKLSDSNCTITNIEFRDYNFLANK